MAVRKSTSAASKASAAKKTKSASDAAASKDFHFEAKFGKGARGQLRATGRGLGGAKSTFRTVDVFGRLPNSRRSAVAVDPFRVKVAVIAEAFGSKAKAAEFLGVARSQPGKWLSGIERPGPRARRKIQDFDYVWDRLVDERTHAAARIWLESPNAFLNGSTPLSWLKLRGAEQVVSAIDAEESGSYA